jgi:phage terminase Nu1 subunit (DNA packaging protein)
MADPITLTAFARLCGVSHAAVHHRIKAGAFPTSARQINGRWMIIDVEKAKEEWTARTRPWVGTRRADTGGGPRASAIVKVTIRERKARARIAELEYERRSAALVPAREVALRWAAIVTAARTQILGQLSRIKQQLPHLTASDLAVIERLTRESLEELSEGVGDEAQSA